MAKEQVGMEKGMGNRIRETGQTWVRAWKGRGKVSNSSNSKDSGKNTLKPQSGQLTEHISEFTECFSII